jgi:hypothetical protein
MFHLCPHKILKMWILIPFFKSVILSRITHLLFAIISTSHYSISINFCCAFAIVYMFVVCCTITFIFVNNNYSCATMFSSFASLCTIYASTKWCSSISSSFDFSMHIKSIDVAFVLVYSLTCQRHLLLHKNSTRNVPVISMSWIIIYTNSIFTLYAFPYAHFEDDDCSNDLTTNIGIFNILWGNFLSLYSRFYEVIILENTYAIGEGKKCKV